MVLDTVIRTESLVHVAISEMII